MSNRVEGFAQGRLTQPLRFELNSAGPQPGQYNPTPRYPDGTPVKQGFSTGSNRGRKPGDAVVGHAADAKAQMIERYKAGEGLQVLAAAYSTHARRVREILVQAGAEIRQPGCKNEESSKQEGDDMARRATLLTSADEAMICDLYSRQERSQVWLAQRFKVTKSRIRDILEAAGLEIRGVGTYSRAPEPDDQMDDPETVVAAATEPPPTVIHVEELMLTRRPYAAPRVLQSGPIASLVRPQNAVAVAHMVGELVEELNTIPGVRADFGFSFQMTAGAR